MKILAGLVLFICFSFPLFSQSSNAQRQRALSDAMTTTIAKNTSILADFDSRSAGDGNIKKFSEFNRRYVSLTKALEASEQKMEFLLRANDRAANIKAEYDNFADLLKKLQDVKSEYDAWLRTVQ